MCSSLESRAFSRHTMLVLASGLNKAALKSMERRQDGDWEEGTWNETMSELDREWTFEDTSGREGFGKTLWPSTGRKSASH